MKFDTALFLAQRDRPGCLWCGKEGETDFDYLWPTFSGGPKILDNQIISCSSCKKIHASRSWRPTEMLELVESRGGEINRFAVHAGLMRLSHVAPYLRGQLGREWVVIRKQMDRATRRKERIDYLLKRDGGCCVWCYVPLSSQDPNITFEHLLPRSVGGPNTLDNMLIACKNCNSARGSDLPSVSVSENKVIFRCLSHLAKSKYKVASLAQKELDILTKAKESNQQLPVE